MGQLTLSRVRKTFGESDVVKSIDLDIGEGEFVVFVGPSGCGKSTLLRMIAGLEEISSGEIRIDGRVVNQLPPVRRGIAMVFQSYALYPHLTVFENIAFPLRVEGAPESVINAKVHAAAQVLQLEPRLKHKPGQLSGGQRQRVAIGRAIVREPKIFLFDEPLSNLDAALRSDMRLELAALHKRLGSTMIYVTHDQIEAMTMADRIVVLSAGAVEQVGSPLELYHRPVNRFVAGFIGSPKMNFLEATVLASDAGSTRVAVPGLIEVTLPVGVPDARVGEPITLGVRPEALSLEPGAGQVPVGQVTMRPGIVERHGLQTVIYSLVGGDVPLGQTPFTALLPGDPAIAENEPLRLGVDPRGCHLFAADGRTIGRA